MRSSPSSCNCSRSWIFINGMSFKQKNESALPLHVNNWQFKQRNAWQGSQKCSVLLFWSRMRPFRVMGVWGRCVLVCLSGMKVAWSVTVGEWVELYLCWTGCPWFCWLSGYIQTGTRQQACNTRPGQPIKDAKQETKKKGEIDEEKCGSVTKKRHTQYETQLNHFHRWNHDNCGVRGYQKMCLCSQVGTLKLSVCGDPQSQSREVNGVWPWCPREGKKRRAGHHCPFNDIPLRKLPRKSWGPSKELDLSNAGLINSISATHRGKWAIGHTRALLGRLGASNATKACLW